MRLKIYINSQIEIFKENAIVALENMDESSIHDLRVAMKRLYALYDQKGIDVSLYHVELRSVRKVFKLFGKIRNLQLLNIFSKRFLDFSVYKDLNTDVNTGIKIIQHQLQTEFSNNYIPKIAKVLKLSLLVQYVLQDDIIYDGLKQHYLKCQNEISELISQSKINYHHIRRLVKKQQYILEMIDVVTITHENPKLLKLKKALGKELGEWHDLKVISDFYKHQNYIPVTVIDSVNQKAQLMLKKIIKKNKEAIVKPLY